MRIFWLSSDTVGEGSLGTTDRLEGARYLLRRGHEVTVVCGATPSDRPAADIPTVFVPTRYRPFLAWFDLWPGVGRILGALEDPPDVVVSDFALLPPLMRWIGGREQAGLPVPATVLDVRTPPVEAGRVRTIAQRARFSMTLKLYAHRVEAITAITEGVRDWAAAIAGWSPDQVPVWRSGCSWCEDEPPTAPWPMELPQEFRHRFVVLYHGTMTPGRGLLEAVRAVDLLRASGAEVALVLLGGGSAVPALHRLVRDRGLQDHVRFVDPVPHHRVPEFIGAADVGLVPLPPRWEWEISSPLKLTEYLCSGLPVVLTDIVAHRIVPSDAPFAFWSPTAQPEGLAAAIRAAHDRHPELPALGRQAKVWAAPRMGWSAQLGMLEQVLLSLHRAQVAPGARR